MKIKDKRKKLRKEAKKSVKKYCKILAKDEKAISEIVKKYIESSK